MTLHRHAHWQRWVGGTVEQLASTPLELKMMWAQIFREILPKIYQKQGPVMLYDTVNTLVRDGAIALEVRRWQGLVGSGHFGFQVRTLEAGPGKTWREWSHIRMKEAEAENSAQIFLPGGALTRAPDLPPDDTVH